MTSTAGPTNQSTLLPLGKFLDKSSNRQFWLQKKTKTMLYFAQTHFNMLIFQTIVLQSWWINVSDHEFTSS